MPQNEPFNVAIVLALPQGDTPAVPQHVRHPCDPQPVELPLGRTHLWPMPSMFRVRSDEGLAVRSITYLPVTRDSYLISESRMRDCRFQRISPWGWPAQASSSGQLFDRYLAAPRRWSVETRPGGTT